MRLAAFKIFLVAIIFICLFNLSGCSFGKLNNLEKDVADLKGDFLIIQRERIDEKQVLEQRLKTLEENLKTSNSRIDDLMQRNPIIGGTVAEEPLAGESK